MRKTLLVQDNTITTARYEMTAMEKNIMYAVMSQLKDDDELSQFYNISIKELSVFTDSRVNLNEFKDAITRLLTRDFSIKRSDGSHLQVTFVSSADWLTDGTVEIGIDPKMRPYLFQLKKNFTTFELDVVMMMKSKFSKRIYEMLCQFKSTGVFKISIENLKERLLLVTEKGTPQYERWSSFEKNVLMTARDEITAKSDFNVAYSLKREGKKITGVDFVFNRKPLLKLENVDLTAQIPPSVNGEKNGLESPISAFVQEHIDAAKAARMIERLREFGLSDIQILEILKKHKEDFIHKTLYDLTLNREQIKSTAGYLVAAFSV